MLGGHYDYFNKRILVVFNSYSTSTFYSFFFGFLCNFQVFLYDCLCFSKKRGMGRYAHTYILYVTVSLLRNNSLLKFLKIQKANVYMCVWFCRFFKKQQVYFFKRFTVLRVFSLFFLVFFGLFFS